MSNPYEDIFSERMAQNAEYGGPKHDDTHSEADWINFLYKHLDRANDNSGDYRYQLVRVAALCVAAIQSHDRKGGAS